MEDKTLKQIEQEMKKASQEPKVKPLKEVKETKALSFKE